MSTSSGDPDMQVGRLLYRGAEADVSKGKWHGLDAVYKVRKPLKYRLPELDTSVRRQRTLHEAQMLHSAKDAGVMTPHLYDLNPSKWTLVMEFIDGHRLKDLADSRSSRVSPLFEDLGRAAAQLHSAGIMHGDLTTANLINRGDDLVFLDFGLSFHSARTEDHAVDLRLIKETITGAHPAVSEIAMQSLLRGYSHEAGESTSRKVMKQLASIERRGRYARVV